MPGWRGGHAWLFGRHTYEGLLASWNAQGGPFKDALNATQKYVASRDPAAQLAWPNSTLLCGDASATVRDLKQATETDLVIMGSGELIAALMGADLIDEYLLLIAPLVLGRGRRLFADGARASLTLRECTTTRTGAVVATYVPAR